MIATESLLEPAKDCERQAAQAGRKLQEFPDYIHPSEHYAKPLQMKPSAPSAEKLNHKTKEKRAGSCAGMIERDAYDET